MNKLTRSSSFPLLAIAVFTAFGMVHAQSPSDAAAPGATEVTIADLTFTQPEGWSATAPSSQMRVAQWSVSKEGQTAEAIFFFFGKDQGGSVQSNFDRWLGQFKEPSETLNPQAAKMQGKKATVHLIRATGTYNPSMPGSPSPDLPDTGFIGVVLEGPEGNVFVRFFGPSSVVAAESVTFLEFIAKAAGVEQTAAPAQP